MLLMRYSSADTVMFTVEGGTDWMPLILPVPLASTPQDVEAMVCAAVDEAAAERPPGLADLMLAVPEAAPAMIRMAVSTGAEWGLAQPPDVLLRVADESLVWESQTGRFTEPVLEQLHRHLARLWDHLGRNDITVGEVPMLDEADLLELDVVNPARTPYRARPVHELIGETARRRPDHPAVVDGTRSLSYAELDALSNGLAHRLVAAGAGPGILVGLACTRSLDMYVAIQGILKSGAGYVPIDPRFPAERIQIMAEDAALGIVVTEPTIAETLPVAAETVVLLDSVTPTPHPPRVEVAASDTAYVIFTSGSTGRPKGVVVPHRALANFLAAMAVEPGLAEHDRVLALTTVSFDMSVLELFLAMFVGATVVVASSETAVDPQALADALDDHDVSFVQATPASWQMLIDAGWAGRPSLRAVCGGEALPKTLAAALLQRLGELWNMYGPTETTVWSCGHRIVSPSDISIGHPVGNTSCFVRGRWGERLPFGVPGELLIGGDGVTDGYLGRPELTSSRFLQDPFGDGSTGRTYATGDLVSLRRDGTFSYLGRIDDQVKIRGFRIELGEVESALCSHPAVLRGVAVARADEPERPRQLVAYVVPRPGQALTEADLRAHVRRSLPDYMVPSAVVFVDSFPLNPNGKVDRRRLPRPSRTAMPTRGGRPRTPTEQVLTDVWTKVLGIPEIGVMDDIFDLGADSLTVARLYATVSTQLGTRLPLAPAFALPTIAALAAHLDGEEEDEAVAPGTTERGSGRWSSLVPIRGTGTRPPLFLVHGGAGTVLHFQPLARRLGEDQPVYAFQAVGLYGDAAPLGSVEDMAAHYIAEMRTVHPEGPYRIGGYCFGALVAYEIARQLTAEGQPPTVLITFNGPSPSYLRRWPDDDGRSRLAQGNGQAGVSGPTRVRQPLVKRLPRKVYWRSRALFFRAWRRALLEYALRLHRPLPDGFRERNAIAYVCARASAQYLPPPIECSMLVVRGSDLHYEDDLGWSDYVTEVSVASIEGINWRPRRTMAEPLVARVAEQVARALA
jgi:amino acid adenylation domain-containing protein